MRKLVFTLILFLMFTGAALAENSTEDNSEVDNSTTDNSTTDNSTTDNSTTDNSTHDDSTTYTIELGDGQGSLLIFGDNNTIYMPPKPETPDEIANEFQAATQALVLGKTDIIAEDGTVTTFTKIVLRIETDGIEILWTEQE